MYCKYRGNFSEWNDASRMLVKPSCGCETNSARESKYKSCFLCHVVLWFPLSWGVILAFPWCCFVLSCPPTQSKLFSFFYRYYIIMFFILISSSIFFLLISFIISFVMIVKRKGALGIWVFLVIIVELVCFKPNFRQSKTNSNFLQQQNVFNHLPYIQLLALRLNIM